MKFNGQFRVVRQDDRNDVVQVFEGADALEKAQAFTRSTERYEIQEAVEAEDGTICYWNRTAAAQTQTRFANSLR